MSREAFGDPPDREPEHCPNCGSDFYMPGCSHCEEVKRRCEAESDLLRIEVVLYVPTTGRCDQHAVEIDGERVGLLSASQIGVRVREMVRKRPSVAALEDCRRAAWECAS